METENNQLVVGGFTFQPFTIKPEVLKMRDNALAVSALIGKVETAKHNELSAAARKQIKSILSLFETNRKRLKEPILEAGRQLDRVVEQERMELLKEDARLGVLEKEFMRAELRRKAEEEELQRKELARIEAEKQAELLRIAREQAEAERKAREAAEAEARKAREAAEAAARLAQEATNKKQREAAEKARLEAERMAEAAKVEAARVAAENAEKARQQAQLAQERADQAAMLESKPVDINRARGQFVKKVWIIDQINDFQLMKARPDLVRKIEWDLVGLKQALADGQKLPGVTAHEDIGVGNRGGIAPKTIDV
jgi:hypothetical protein